jgi:hypothetical protein
LHPKGGITVFVIKKKCIALAGKTENRLFVLPPLLTGVVAAITKRYRRDVTHTVRSAIPMVYRAHRDAPVAHRGAKSVLADQRLLCTTLSGGSRSGDGSDGRKIGIESLPHVSRPSL